MFIYGGKQTGEVEDTAMWGWPSFQNSAWAAAFVRTSDGRESSLITCFLYEICWHSHKAHHCTRLQIKHLCSTTCSYQMERLPHPAPPLTLPGVQIPATLRPLRPRSPWAPPLDFSPHLELSSPPIPARLYQHSTISICQHQSPTRGTLWVAQSTRGDINTATIVRDIARVVSTTSWRRVPPDPKRQLRRIHKHDRASKVERNGQPTSSSGDQPATARGQYTRM